MLNQEEKSRLIQSVWLRFNSNIGALHIFFENLAPNADRVDNDKLKHLVDEMTFIFKDKPEIAQKDILKYIPSVDDLDFLPDFRDSASVKELLVALQDHEIRDSIQAWEEKHPHRSQRLSRVFSSSLSNPPMTGVMLRRSMLISLVTFLEIFLGDIYKSHYQVLGQSKEDACKESRKLMKGNWRNKLTNLQKIGLDIQATTKYSEEIFEITQRRHVLVHNDGIVDEGYKKYFSKYNYGDHLLVSTRYFQRGINIVHTLCFLLFCNQLTKYEENKQVIYNKLDDFVLNSLEQRRYSLVIELSENAEFLDLPENKRQIVIANRAIAYRELGKTEEVNRIVTFLESAEHGLEIELAISMLRNDIVNLRRQIKLIPNHPGNARMFSWPLFNPIKNEVWFKMEIARISKSHAPKTRRKH